MTKQLPPPMLRLVAVGRLPALAALAAALLLLPNAAAGADDDDDADPPHITLRGTASAPFVPDVAVLRLGVGAEDADAAAALAADAAALAAVIEAAKAEGVAAADVQAGTTMLERVAPEKPPAGTGPSRVFRAATALRIRLHDPARVGAVLAALAGKGATRVEGVDYDLADPAALLAKLTGQAVADARRRAEAAAGAANVRLGEVLSIEPPDEPADSRQLVRFPGLLSTTVEVEYAIER